MLRQNSINEIKNQNPKISLQTSHAERVQKIRTTITLTGLKWAWMLPEAQKFNPYAIDVHPTWANTGN